MPQSLSRIWLHIVFSTKERRTYLQHDGFREEMFRMLGHHVDQTKCVSAKVGGWHDHVHLVCGLSRTVTVSSLIGHVKMETSKWAKSADHGSSTFSWQNGYAAFSVSQSNLEKVIEYVNQQPAHHAHRTFQDELRELCARHEIEIDEQYVWD